MKKVIIVLIFLISVNIYAEPAGKPKPLTIDLLVESLTKVCMKNQPCTLQARFSARIYSPYGVTAGFRISDSICADGQEKECFRYDTNIRVPSQETAIHNKVFPFTVTFTQAGAYNVTVKMEVSGMQQKKEAIRVEKIEVI